jgi:hypothetical protein
MQAIQVSDTGRSLWHQTFFLLCNIGLETKVIYNSATFVTLV